MPEATVVAVPANIAGIEVDVPRERHEHVRQDEHQYGPDSLHNPRFFEKQRSSELGAVFLSYRGGDEIRTRGTVTRTAV